MTPEEKLDQEVTIIVPVKFVSAILRALLEAATLNQLIIRHNEDLDKDELLNRAACISCYGQVHEILKKIEADVLKPEDIEAIREVGTKIRDEILQNAADMASDRVVN